MLKKFLEAKRYWYFLPRSIRFKIFNLKLLKKYHTSTGIFFLPFFASKDRIRNSIINNKIFDEKIFYTLEKLINPNSIVLDVGSNFGQMSILWSKCKPNVKVYSFEASNFIFQILEKNIQINKANVEAFNYLVGNESNNEIFLEKPVLKQFTTYGSNHLKKINSQKKNNSEKIKAIKIDDIQFSQPISAMKIDVQGYDLEVLKGAKQTIKRFQMPIIFEYEKDFEKNLNYNFKDFLNFIDSIDYKISSKIDEQNFLIEKI